MLSEPLLPKQQPTPFPCSVSEPASERATILDSSTSYSFDLRSPNNTTRHLPFGRFIPPTRQEDYQVRIRSFNTAAGDQARSSERLQRGLSRGDESIRKRKKPDGGEGSNLRGRDINQGRSCSCHEIAVVIAGMESAMP